MITALTGPFSAERTHDVAVVQALIKSTNAAGGVDGHPLVLDVKDDQSTAAGALAAAQVLVSDGVVGIAFDDATVEGGPAQYLHQQGMPVTGLGDSPSWISDDNMFGENGYTGTSMPITTSFGVIEKHLGAGKVAAVSYGTNPPSYDAAAGFLKGAQQAGVSSAANIGIALSGQNFTSTALQVKSLGVQGLITTTSAEDNVSLATALSQEGLHLPGVVFGTGYEQDVLQSSSVSALNGTYVMTSNAPADVTSPGETAFKALLQKYAPGVFPGSQEAFAYVDAYLLISGLKADGGSNSPADLLHGISGLTDFTAGGILAQSINYSKPKTTQVERCYFLVEVKQGQFVAAQQQAFCGSVAGS